MQQTEPHSDSKRHLRPFPLLCITASSLYRVLQAQELDCRDKPLSHLIAQGSTEEQPPSDTKHTAATCRIRKSKLQWATGQTREGRKQNHNRGRGTGEFALFHFPNRNHTLHKIDQVSGDDRTEGYEAENSENWLQSQDQNSLASNAVTRHFQRKRQFSFSKGKTLTLKHPKSSLSCTPGYIHPDALVFQTSSEASAAPRAVPRKVVGREQPRAYLPLAVCLHQLAQRGVPLDFELHDGAILPRHFQVDVIILCFHAFLEEKREETAGSERGRAADEPRHHPRHAPCPLQPAGAGRPLPQRRGCAEPPLTPPPPAAPRQGQIGRAHV